jgi:hypothetical protein
VCVGREYGSKLQIFATLEFVTHLFIKAQWNYRLLKNQIMTLGLLYVVFSPSVLFVVKFMVADFKAFGSPVGIITFFQ